MHSIAQKCIETDDSSALTLLEEMMMAATITTGSRLLPPPKSTKADNASFGSSLKAGFLTKSSFRDAQYHNSSSSGSSSSSSSSSNSSSDNNTQIAVSMSSPSSASAELLAEKILSSPLLRKALENPRFQVIFTDLGSDPQATLVRYQHDNAAMGFLRGLMGALGEHFEELGKQQQQQSGQNKTNAACPLMQAALEKADKQKIQPVNDLEQDKAEQEAVNRILRDPELRNLLLDPTMQTVLQSFSESDKNRGSVLHKYIPYPIIAAKLGKLADAGLIQTK